MKAINFLWLDDEPANGSKHIASDELKLKKGISKSSSFINVKGKDMWAALKNDVYPTLGRYDIILIDHNFGATLDASLTGSTVAESIRDREKKLPIIAITNVSDIDIHKQSAYDDVIEFTRDISQKVDYLKSISEGYHILNKILNKKKPATNDDLLKLMKAPKDDHERIRKIMPHELKSKMSDPSFASLFYKWIKFKFMERPGFLLDRLWTSTLLGIKENRFSIVEGLFEKAKYGGIFSRTSNGRWWQSKIKKILFDTLSDQPEMLPWRLGHTLPGLSSSDIPICHACKDKFPEIIAFTDETGKTSRPMHIKCTKLHKEYESSLYFEDIRVMRAE